MKPQPDIRLWLDDIHKPPALGWAWCKTVEDAQEYFRTGRVVEASLDHDLGRCADCRERDHEAGVLLHPVIVGSCEHMQTGYDLACWLEVNPQFAPRRIIVHSNNPTGADRMVAALSRIALVMREPYRG